MVRVRELPELLDAKAVAEIPEVVLDVKLSNGYVSDLLSNVMGQARSDGIWVTMQGHQNVVAVAVLAGLGAVVIAGGVKPDQDAVKKAAQEGLALFTTDLTAFETVGRLHQAGVVGV